MADLTRLTAAAAARALTKGDITSQQLTEAHLSRIAAVEPEVHAFLHVSADSARAVAAHIDERRAAGEKLHPLAGVPIAIKDLVVAFGLPTTAGSKMLENWVPPYDATIVERVKAAGLPILGKTNLDEFAMGSSTEFSAFGITRNPWNLTCIPGGSGGGSAAAVAAFEAPLAIGTDTGGSIRQPGAVTGTVGVKPTYGSVSRYGCIALASSLDQAGPVARTVLDAALLHELIGGHDPMDATSLREPLPTLVEAAIVGATGHLNGVRIGVVRQLQGAGYEPAVLARFSEALDTLVSLGADVVEVDCPHFEYAFDAYYLIMPAEASSNLAKFDGVRFGLRVEPQPPVTTERMMAASRERGFGPEVKRRIILGTYALSAGHFDEYYGAAQRVRTLIQQDFAAAFAQVEVLVSPTTPTTAFPFGSKIDDPLAMYLNDVATIPANLAGVPAMTVPSGLSEAALPTGFQILAPAKADDRLYLVGAALEAALEKKWGGPLLDRAPALG